MTAQELIDRYSSLSEETKRLVEDFVSIVSRASGNKPEPRKSKGEITDEPAFGMWANRKEATDRDYLRRLRRREWREPA